MPVLTRRRDRNLPQECWRVYYGDVEAAWRVFLAKRTEADFRAWRDQQVWTTEKYRRFDRGERMPADWRPGA